MPYMLYVLGCLRRSTASKWREVIPSIQPWWGGAWCAESSSGLSNTKKDMDLPKMAGEDLGRQQMNWSISPMTKCWKSWDCSAQKSEGLEEIIQYLKWWCKNWASLSSVASSDSTRGNGYNRKHRSFLLNIRRNSFTMQVTEHWNTLPRGWWCLLLEAIQKLPRHGPGHFALSAPAWVGEVGLDDL